MLDLPQVCVLVRDMVPPLHVLVHKDHPPQLVHDPVEIKHGNVSNESPAQSESPAVPGMQNRERVLDPS